MGSRKHHSIIRAQLTEFTLPPITDGLVLGRSSPIGHVAVGKALSLLTTIAFEHLPIEDEIISDVLIRRAILRKSSKEQLIKFILQEVKPIMGSEEIIHLDLQVDVLLELTQ